MIKRNYEMFCLSYGRLNDNDKKMRWLLLIKGI